MRSTALAERATVRLVSDAHWKPPVLRPLVDDDAELAVLARLDEITSRRRRAEAQELSGLDARELAFRARARALGAWGDACVNAAFAYARPGGNRFNGEDRGAWYAAFDDLTAIAEVGWHRTRELASIARFHDAGTYVALLADFIGDFPDLRGALAPCLGPDPVTAYPEGQRLARELRAEGGAGLVYPSVRRPGGTCFVAFEPQIVQNIRPGARWRLVWDGTPDFTVEGR